MADTTYDNNMPTNYDTGPSGGAGRAGGGAVQINMGHLTSPNGILQIVQAVLSLITFICAAVWWPWANVGGGWVMFVSMVSFIIITILFFLYFTDIVYKIPGPFQFMQIIYYAVTSLMYLIAAIVASARAGQWWGHSSVKATAVFSWFTTIAFVVHLVLQLLEWRRAGSPGLPAALGGTSTTTSQQQSTEVEAGKPQY